MLKLKALSILLLLLPFVHYSQDITLFQQFNGRYDYVAFGNTLNTGENGGATECEILTESSAEFSLDPNQEVIAAYIYWAGSGEGDFEISLNGNSIIAQRDFSYTLISGTDEYLYFAAFADITSLISSIGNNTYTITNLDLFEAIQPFCQINDGNATNFGGWAVTVVYQDESLPLNQVAIFDGLQAVSQFSNTLDVTLENLNVLDNTGAKIGFLAWEGDASLAIEESLLINGNLISNPPLNPEDNAFNSTNSFTNSSELYNMDIDFYDIENNINPGDINATIRLTSGRDLVMVNNIITVLNTELPDATIEITDTIGEEDCGNREIEIEYTVYNNNSTATLPAQTPIAFYTDNFLIAQSETNMDLIIDEFESSSILVTIPDNMPADFILKAIVDDIGNGTGIVSELNEDNNNFEIDFHIRVFPDVDKLVNLETCDVLGDEFFNLSLATQNIDANYSINYFLSEEDAENQENVIVNLESYTNSSNPETIYIRVDNGDCYVIESFTIEVIICPLPDATITIDNTLYACRARDLLVEYTVYNLESTDILPANTPIALYLDGMLYAQMLTQNPIPINDSESAFIELTLSESIPETFIITIQVDDIGNGNGIVEEFIETNNDYEITVTFGSIPPIEELPNLLQCDEGFDTATFNLTEQNELISQELEDVITYFTTEENAISNTEPISNPETFQNSSDPQIIYVRLENEICFTTSSFLVSTENCIPKIPEGFSPSGDGINDEFEIDNLLNVYSNFELLIYTRLGNLIYKGNNEDGYWNGISNKGLLFENSLVPVGVYYYVLHLRDPQYLDPFIGDVYVNY